MSDESLADSSLFREPESKSLKEVGFLFSSKIHTFQVAQPQLTEIKDGEGIGSKRKCTEVKEVPKYSFPL